MTRQISGANKNAMSFGQSRAREVRQSDKTRILFKDVAGVKTAKEELEEIVEFLVNQKNLLYLERKSQKVFYLWVRRELEKRF